MRVEIPLRWRHTRAAHGALAALAALAMVLAVAACDRMLTRPAPYSSVHVTAADGQGKPLPNVNLTLYAGNRIFAYGMTGADGQYLFQYVPSGPYGVNAIPPAPFTAWDSATGTHSREAWVTFVAPRDSAADVALRFFGPGVLIVNVHGTDGKPVPNAMVQYYAGREVLGSAYTNDSGRVQWDSVPVGTKFGVVIVRPTIYRVFTTVNDSIYQYFVPLYMSGQTDTVRVNSVLAKCAGLATVQTLDQNGNPVAGVRNEFYSSLGPLDTLFSGSDGKATAEVPCVIPSGVRITVPSGYSVQPGLGTSYYESFYVANGDTVGTTLRVVKNP